MNVARDKTDVLYYAQVFFPESHQRCKKSDPITSLISVPHHEGRLTVHKGLREPREIYTDILRNFLKRLAELIVGQQTLSLIGLAPFFLRTKLA